MFDQDVNKDGVKEIYLLVAAFLSKQGHQKAFQSLLNDCGSGPISRTVYNWQGDAIEEALAGEAILEHVESGNGPTETTLQQLLQAFQNYKAESGGPTKKLSCNLLSLSRQIVDRIEAKSVLVDGRNGDLFPFRTSSMVQGVLMPWRFGSPWTETLLNVNVSSYHHLKTIIGHRLPAYCVLFDRSDNRIITGGDDGLVKIWCAKTGFLLFSLRSHSNCISDMSIDPFNRVLAVGSLDGYISFWDVQNGAPLFTINAFSPILTLEFRPTDQIGKEFTILATCSDGYAKFWLVNLQQRSYVASPVKYHCKALARDEIRCAAFSPGGSRFITGATDGIIRLLCVPDVADIKAGTQPPITQPYIQYLDDHDGYVNSVYYASCGTKFVTSSWDGTVKEWRLNTASGTWTSDTFSIASVVGPSHDPFVPGRPHKVTIVSYCCNDEAFVAAINQTHELLVFDTKRRQKPRILSFHTGEIYVLTAHSIDDRILLSAGCDGKAALWNMATGELLFQYELPNTRFLDGNFSQDGTMFTLTDDLGRISLFGSGISADTYAAAPSSQFFLGDWNELIFDAQRNALDAITQRPPHFGPRNTIVSIEKAPHPLGVKEGYALTIPLEGDEWVAERQKHLLMRQMHNEKRLFEQEIRFTPPGVIPKHVKAKRKRLVYGSDMEDDVMPPLAAMDRDEDQEEFFMPPLSASETDAEVSVDDDSDLGPYNLRRNRPASAEPTPRTRRSVPIPEILDEDEESLLATRRRGRPRRLPEGGRNQHAMEPSIPEPSPWLTSKDRQMFPYLPQLYDVVVYLPEGHKRFLLREQSALFNENLPWDVEGRNIGHVVFAQVLNVSFLPGPHPTCILELAILSPSMVKEELPTPVSLSSSIRKIQIAYYDMDNMPDFIIPYCRYAWSVQNRYEVGDEVRVLFSKNESYEAKVSRVKVSHDRIPDRPWQCYLVEWLTLSDVPEALSPWELEPLNTLSEDYQCWESLSSEAVTVLLDAIKSVCSEQEAIHFKKPVPLDLYRDYLDCVAYPMDISLIRDRLHRGYYHRIEAFEWDVQLLYENAVAYNHVNSPIVQDAEHVVNALLRASRRAQRGMRRSQRSEDSFGNRGSLTSTRRAAAAASVPIEARPRQSNSVLSREARAQRRATMGLTSSPMPASTEEPRPVRGTTARRQLSFGQIATTGNSATNGGRERIVEISSSEEVSGSGPLGSSQRDHFVSPYAARLRRLPAISSESKRSRLSMETQPSPSSMSSTIKSIRRKDQLQNGKRRMDSGPEGIESDDENLFTARSSPRRKAKATREEDFSRRMETRSRGATIEGPSRVEPSTSSDSDELPLRGLRRTTRRAASANRMAHIIDSEDEEETIGPTPGTELPNRGEGYPSYGDPVSSLESDGPNTRNRSTPIDTRRISQRLRSARPVNGATPTLTRNLRRRSSRFW